MRCCRFMREQGSGTDMRKLKKELRAYEFIRMEIDGTDVVSGMVARAGYPSNSKARNLMGEL